jgi:hypothetical protein
MADQQRPVWRQVFDAIEQAVAPGLENAVRSDPFADFATVVTRLRSGVGRRAEQASRRALHLWNLPAGSDIKRVSDQIASLERRVRELSKRLEDLAEGIEGINGQRVQPHRPRRSHSA